MRTVNWQARAEAAEQKLAEMERAFKQFKTWLAAEKKVTMMEGKARRKGRRS